MSHQRKAKKEAQCHSLGSMIIEEISAINISKGVGWNLVTKDASSAVVLSAIALATVGASLVLVTMRLRYPRRALDPSVAVPTAIVPTSSWWAFL